MSLGALDISAPTLHTQCHRHSMCSPNPALSTVWKRVENRTGVYFIRFSLPSPTHLWDLSVTCLVSFSGTWSAFQRENNPVFPWEEAYPRNWVFWEASKSSLTLCAEKYTILNLLKWWPCHTSPIFEGKFCSLSSVFWGWDGRTAYGRLPWLFYRSPTVRLEVGIYRRIMEGDICMYSLPLGDRWLQGTGTSPRALAHLALHPLAQSWARPHCPCPALQELWRGALCTKDEGSTLAKCLHSTTAPCIPGRIKPFVHDCVCATAIYLYSLGFFSLSFFFKR